MLQRVLQQMKLTPWTILLDGCNNLWYIINSNLTRVRSTGFSLVSTQLLPGPNIPPPVSARCLKERYSFGNFPRTVQRHQSTWKELEGLHNWGPATPLTLYGKGPETDGILTSTVTDCGPQDVGTSSVFGWSEIVVKPSRRGGDSGGAPHRTFDVNLSKRMPKCHFLTSCIKVKKI
jgi:hypothetical protein